MNEIYRHIYDDGQRAIDDILIRTSDTHKSSAQAWFSMCYVNTLSTATCVSQQHGQMGSADPPLKIEKLSENMQKRAVFWMGGWGWSDTSDDYLVKLMIYIIVIIIAPFCRKIFKIFFTSGGKGALTP